MKQFILIAITCFLFASLKCDKVIAFPVKGVEFKKHSPPATPNIIFLMIDDEGYEIPTIDGGQSYSTPNFDALAALGTRYTSMLTAATCSPSRIEFLTGKYNYRNYFTTHVMEDSNKTVANLAKLAGYNTAIYGKWQISGGDKIRSLFGFDRYSVLFPNNDEDGRVRYKNPTLFSPTGASPSAGYYYPTGYSDDIFVDSAKSFIDDNVASSTPFFLYVPFSGPHTPHSPVPGDPAYASWNPRRDKSDTIYFPEMVSYVDAKVKQIVDYVTTKGIQNNTVIIVTADNGTSAEIKGSMWNGIRVPGGKKATARFGVNTPMIIKWTGTVAAGAVNNDMINFSDFLPTFADLMGVSIPGTWGTIDGHSFYNQLIGASYTPRAFSYTYWGVLSGHARVWAETPTRKLYSGGQMYNKTTDFFEACPLSDTTGHAYLQGIINSYHQ